MPPHVADSVNTSWRTSYTQYKGDHQTIQSQLSGSSVPPVAPTARLWVLLIIVVLALPAVSLFSPTFSPGWLKLIPSYHTLFALDAAMFPDDNSHIIWQGAAVMVAVNVVLVFLSTWIFGKLIEKEV